MSQLTRLRFLIAVVPVIWASPVLAQSQESQSQETRTFDFEKVAAEAEEACAALAKFNQENEPNAFDFKSITTYGSLADAFLIAKRNEKAKNVLLHSLPEADVNRLVATTAVKFGAPVPRIPESVEDAKRQIWRLEIFVSLAHGGRYDEAIEVLKSFPQKSQTVPVRLRYIKIITENCVKNQNRDQARKFASLMWKQIRQLDEKEISTSLDYSLYLVELAQKLKLNDSVKSLLPIVQKQFKRLPDSSQSKIESESLYRFFRRLGLACARHGEYPPAREYLEKARVEIDRIQGDFFEREEAHANLQLAFAETCRKANQNKEALDHTKKALEWLAKINTDKAQSIANSIDGGGGFFSAVLGFTQFSTLKEVVMEQAKLGEFKSAEETWNSIPFSIQKLHCQIELAEHFQESKQLNHVLDSANFCLKLAETRSELTDVVSCQIAAALIYHKSGQLKRRDSLVKRVIEKVIGSKNESAKQNLANDLVAMGLFDEAYLVIQSITAQHERAGPLASLAKALAERQKK